MSEEETAEVERINREVTGFFEARRKLKVCHEDLGHGDHDWKIGLRLRREKPGSAPYSILLPAAVERLASEVFEDDRISGFLVGRDLRLDVELRDFGRMTRAWPIWTDRGLSLLVDAGGVGPLSIMTAASFSMLRDPQGLDIVGLDPSRGGIQPRDVVFDFIARWD